MRNLERELANLAKAVKELATKNKKSIRITRRNLDKFAGARYRFGEMKSEDLVGVTTGLAWTEVEESCCRLKPC